MLEDLVQILRGQFITEEMPAYFEAALGAGEVTGAFTEVTALFFFGQGAGGRAMDFMDGIYFLFHG